MDKKKYTTKEVKKKVRDYARYLKDVEHVPVRKVYLFGSYAKRKAHAWSDIDVAIVSPIFAKEDWLSFLWHRLRREDADAIISPVGFSPQDFRGEISSPLVHEIKTTGEEISLV